MSFYLPPPLSCLHFMLQLSVSISIHRKCQERWNEVRIQVTVCTSDMRHADSKELLGICLWVNLFSFIPWPDLVLWLSLAVLEYNLFNIMTISFGFMTISFGYILHCVCFNLYCGGFILLCNVCGCMCAFCSVCVCLCGFCNVWVFC